MAMLSQNPEGLSAELTKNPAKTPIATRTQPMSVAIEPSGLSFIAAPLIYPAAPISSRPISMRLISFVPAPMSSSLASRR